MLPTKLIKSLIKYTVETKDADLPSSRLDDVGEVILSTNIPDDFKVRMIKECIERRKVVYAIPQLLEISLSRPEPYNLRTCPPLS